MIAKSIAFFLPNLSGGGAEKVTVNLINELSKNYDSIYLILACATGDFLSQISSSINLIDLKSPRVSRCLFSLTRVLRELNVSLLVSSLPHANIIACAAVRLSRQPIQLILVEHNNISSSFSGAPIKHQLILGLMKLTYPWANKIVCVSEGAKDDFSRHIAIDPSRVLCIYNPVIGSELWEKATQACTHPWLQNKDLPVLINVGRLAEQKNQRLLIDAFAIVNRKRPARLLIYGEGPLRDELIAQAELLNLSDSVRIERFTPNPYAEIKAADLFVLSSDYEGLPTVLIEALALGCRIVSTDCPNGPSEILQGGALGSLVPIRNANALAETILKSMDTQPPGIQEIRDAVQVFDVSFAAKRYGEIINASLTSTHQK